MKDIVISTKEDFIFKNKLYDEVAIKSIVKKKIDLFIFEENILIKEFEDIKKAKEFIMNMIKKEKNYIYIQWEMEERLKI